MADDHPQAAPTTPETEKSKTVPTEGKPIEQPAKPESPGTPGKTS